ncbi:MAG TPA: T9SS type A sorting domain-containing protein [Bacteroidales bacterium]|nr:T9SS type A sorting domain-containing protein [Bacteroidales bacterium]
MKKNKPGLSRAMMLIASLLLYTAQTLATETDFTIQVRNLTQPTDRTIEFDVYLLDNDPAQPFQLGSMQLGFLLNSGIYTGGTLTVSYSNTESGLNSLQQFTAVPSIASSLAGYSGQTLIRLAGKTPPGSGGGTIISSSGDGTLVAHFILANSIAWIANQTADLAFTSGDAVNPLYATRVSQYVGTVNTAMIVTPGTNALVCCNPSLNSAAPVAFSVTGSGSYCQGGAGLPVGLSGSEAGATYQLLKDGVAFGSPVAGTGSSINFGNQTSGTYTVSGTIGSATTQMSGAALVTETPPPTQPGDFTASSSVVYKGTQGVVFTVPAVAGASSYTWTYSGSGASFSGTGNSITINFSSTATSGILSVSANNSCGASVARTISITVNSVLAADHLLQVLNLTQPTDNTIEFDIYLKDTEPLIPMQLASVQFGLLLNSAVYSGGALTATINNAGSGLLLSQQFTATPSVVTTLSGYPNQTLIRLAGNTPPGAGSGTIISTTGNGTLLTHFTLTSTVPWIANSFANISFTSGVATTPLYATRISEYIGTTNTSLEVIPGTNALICCNPALNAGPPVAYAVIGGGAYCEGNTGLPVDLASSQTGVSYQLFRNGLATGIVIAGTGSAISFGNQAAGTYTVSGTNIAGTTPMTGTTVITMNPLPLQPGDFTASASAVCQGTTGVIYTVPADPSVTFAWTYSGQGATINGSGNSVTLSFSSTATSGTLSVMASNSCGTSNARTMSIIVNVTPVPSLTGLATVCEGISGVVYTTDPGKSAYQWIVSAGGTITSGGTSADNTVTVTWSASGSQSVSVSYNNGNCTAANPTAYPVTVNQVPAAPVASVTQQPTCDVPAGTITISTIATGYSIDGTDYSNTTGIFSGIVPGNYSITIRNAAGCVSPATQVTVNAVPGAPAAPVATVTLQPTCDVATGTITVTSPVPAAGIFFSTDGVNYINTTGIFTGISSGTYSVTYKDGSACISAPSSVTVNPAPSAPSTPVINPVQPLCGETIGVINVTSPAPEPGMTYSIDGFDYSNTSGIFTGVIPGTYSVTVKNAAGCVSLHSSTTINPAPETPVIPIATATQQPTCEISTGTIIVSPPVPAPGITYSIDGVDYTNTSGIFLNVVPGTYDVTVKNASGCVSSPATVIINQAPSIPSTPVATVTQQPTCDIQSGTITISSPVPSAGLGFSLDGIDYTNTTGTFTNLSPGIYNVTVRNASGCISQSVPLTVNSIPGPPVQPGSFTVFTSVVYKGTSNVVYTVPADPSATSYIWTYSGTGASITGNTNSVLVSFSSSATSGAISAIAVNGCGSGAARSIDVTLNSLLESDYMLQALNMTQSSPTTLEFDVYLLDTEPTQLFELASVQLGFLLNSGIYSPGTLNVSISNTTSGLNALQQFTATPTIGEGLTGYPGQTLIRLAGKTPPGSGNGTIISTAGNGTLLTHFIISGSVPFNANTRPEIVFTSGSAVLPLYATRLSEYIGGINTALIVTPGINANVCCNPLLNAASPVAYNVTGSGSYCEGGSGLNVGLSGSETGASYQLFRDAVATGLPINGTGASLDFGAQTAGTYTITGTNLTGSTQMNGSAVITAIPLPAQPGDFIVSSPVVYQGATGVTYSVPSDPSVTYTWSYSGTGVTMSSPLNSITANFSSTATSGTLSVTANNSCGTSAARTLSITVNPLSSADYLLQVLNFMQPTDNTIEFDVYLLDTSPSQAFQLASVQIGLVLNSDFYTGTLTASINNSGSGLLSSQQFTSSPSVVATLAGYPGKSLLRLAGNIPPGSGNGTVISTAGNGTLLTHFILTGAVPFAPNTRAGLEFTSGTALTPLYATRLSEYVGTTNTPLDVIPGTNALVCCDPLLNAWPPAAYSITGGGAYCEGGAGLSVDLAGSQTGVDYQLYRNGMSVGTPISGTGSSISFGIQTAGVYTVTGTNISGSTPMTGSAIIIMTPSPLQPGEFTSSTSLVCRNTAGVVYTVPNDPSVTYTWSYSGSGVSITSNGNSASVSFSETATSGDLAVSARNTCGTSIPRTLAITVNSRPAPLITGLSSVCEGAMGVVYSTEPGMSAYQWDISPGGLITSGGTNSDNNVTVTWSTAGSQFVSVNYSNGNCTALNAVIYPVTILQLPSPVATDIIQPTCAVSTGTITVTSPVPAAGIFYSIDGADYTNTSGVFTGVNPGTYSITVKNAAGCISAPTAVTVNAAPSSPEAPVVSVTSQPTCDVATGTITVTSPVPAAGIFYSIDGSDYTNTSGVFTGVNPGTYSVTVKNAAGCVSAPAPVTVNAAPSSPEAPVARVDEQPGCETFVGIIVVSAPAPAIGIFYSLDGVNYTNTSGVFNSVNPGTYNITYRGITGCVSAPAIVVVNEPPVTPEAPLASVTEQPTCDNGTGTITVTSPAPAPGWTFQYAYNQQELVKNTTGIFTGLVPGIYYISVVSPDGCTSYATPLTVNSVPEAPSVPVAEVTQPTCIISTGIITVTAPGEPGLSYSIDGADYTNTSGVFSGVAPGTYSVTVKNAAGCVSAPASVIVKDPESELPVQPGEFIESTTYMCAGTSATYTVPFEESVTYIWSFSGIGATISGNGNSVNVSFSSTATSGNLSVKAVNSCGAGLPREIGITVRQLPGPAGEIIGENFVCKGMKGVIYTVAVIPNAVHYLWTIPDGATIVSGDDTNTITVDYSNDAVSGVITVQGSKLCGTGEVSSELKVTVRPLPDPAGIITGPKEVCAGARTVVYTVPVIQNAVHYIWSVPAGASILSGSDSNSITVNFSDDAQSGIITVKGSKSCGTGKASPEFRVTVKPKPMAAVISLIDGILVSDASIGNQWYLAENPLKDATDEKLVPVENGRYFAVVTLDGCRSDKSNTVDVVLPEKGLKNTDIDIYPVPTKGDFTVSITTEDEKTIDILVYNSSGNKVYEIHNVKIKNKTDLPFELGTLPAGIYYLRFVGADGQAIKTVILTR